MANNKNQTSLMRRLLSLGRQINSIYKDTYSSDPNNKDEIERISNDIEDNISAILTRNNTSDISNITDLYAKASLNNALKKTEYVKAITSFFDDRTITDKLINTYSQNKWISELDREIDVVCKYMPKLVEALDAIKDSVLTADNYDKEYLSFNSPNISMSEVPVFTQEIEQYMETYKFADKAEKWYESASRYGEVFIYKVPYNKALATLMNRRNEINHPAISGSTESSTIIESTTILREFNRSLASRGSDYKNEFKTLAESLDGLKLEIDKSGALRSAIQESAQMRKMLSVAESVSITEAKDDAQILKNDYFEMPNLKKLETDDKTSSDGTITTNDLIDPDQLKVNGLLLKDLKHENMILLYLDDICLGYYYLEFTDRAEADIFSDNIFTRKNLSSIGYNVNSKMEDQITQQSATDELLRYLSTTIVDKLDDKFINNNAYLKKEIYAILKHHDTFVSGNTGSIRITYLAPDDVEHLFFKEDPDTHRGISDLLAGLIPAKLWCCLTIADTIGILTRGQDKRAYYVKQNVEQNIAQTLLNVINQIKKQNMNIMQIENMNSILGITGRYNDYIIPVGPSGDPPIQMEVMQGQEINPQTELLDKLEESAVNLTGIPIEMVNARLNLDFATQLTMSNSKYMRFVFKRQAKLEAFLGRVMTAIYNAEHHEDTAHIIVKCILPAPIMLSMNNLNQVIDLVQNQANLLANITYPDSEKDADMKRTFYSKNYIRHKLGSYLKQQELDMIKAKSDLDYALNKKNEDEDNNQ